MNVTHEWFLKLYHSEFENRVDGMYMCYFHICYTLVQMDSNIFEHYTELWVHIERFRCFTLIEPAPLTCDQSAYVRLWRIYRKIQLIPYIRSIMRHVYWNGIYIVCESSSNISNITKEDTEYKYTNISILLENSTYFIQFHSIVATSGFKMQFKWITKISTLKKKKSLVNRKYI